jgi:hypothetical protein
VALAAGMLASAASPATAADYQVLPFGTIAWTGSSAVIASASASGALYYWWNPGGDTSWHQEAVPTPRGVTISNPTIAWTGSAVVITALGSNRELYFWEQPDGAPTWNPPTELPNPAGDWYQAPSIAALGNGQVVIASWDIQGNFDSWSTANLGQTWGSDQVSPPSGVKFEDVSLAATPSNWVAAAGASNGQLYYWWSSYGLARPGWPPAVIWHQQSVPDSSNFEDPSITWAGSEVAIAAGTSYGAAIGVFTQPVGSPYWSGPQMLPVEAAILPSIAWTGDGLVVTGISVSLYVWAWRLPNGSTAWQGPATVSAASTFGGASVASLGGNSVGIAAMDTYRDTEDYWRSTNGSTWPSSPQQVSTPPCC